MIGLTSGVDPDRERSMNRADLVVLLGEIQGALKAGKR